MNSWFFKDSSKGIKQGKKKKKDLNILMELSQSLATSILNILLHILHHKVCTVQTDNFTNKEIWKSALKIQIWYRCPGCTQWWSEQRDTEWSRSVKWHVQWWFLTITFPFAFSSIPWSSPARQKQAKWGFKTTRRNTVILVCSLYRSLSTTGIQPTLRILVVTRRDSFLISASEQFRISYV